MTKALQQEILANPTLMSDPRTKATRHALQTQQLLQPNDVAIPALVQLLRAAVDRYAEMLDDTGGTDVFVTHRPGQVRISSSAVVIPARAGKDRIFISAVG